MCVILIDINFNLAFRYIFILKIVFFELLQTKLRPFYQENTYYNIKR